MKFEKRILAGGRATLYRGDCLELLREGAFGKIGAIATDPPYGIGYQHGGGRGIRGVARGKYGAPKTDPIHGDDAPFDPSPWIEAAPTTPVRQQHYGGELILCLWGADNFRKALPDGGTMLAWDKHLGRASDDSFADCEWAWVGRKVKREVFRWMWKGVCTRKSPLDAAPGGRHFRRVHVSQKPVELMRWCIDKVRPLPGLPVLDPYMGSGSTGVAALSLGMSFTGCEIDPEHFEAACLRIEAAHAQGAY